MFRKLNNVVLGLSVSAAMAVPAFALDSSPAAGPDFSTLTSSVSFVSVIAGIMTISASLVGLKLAEVGARKLIAFLR